MPFFNPLKSLLILTTIIILSGSSSAQYQNITYTTEHSIKPDFSLGLMHNLPKSYSVNAELYVGLRTVSTPDSIPYGPNMVDYSFKGLSFEGSLYKGGRGLGVAYFNYSQSMVLAVGYRLGLYYFTNFDNSRVLKDQEFIGIKGSFSVMIFETQIGVFKNLNSSQVVPFFGIGLHFGPFL